MSLKRAMMERERESCGVAGWLERATREGEIDNNWSEVRRESLLG
jgi:hypothetical protein